MPIKMTISTALAGLLSAVIVDINAWAKSDGVFDWKLAFKRWVAGVIAGLLGGGSVTATTALFGVVN